MGSNVVTLIPCSRCCRCKILYPYKSVTRWCV